MYCTLVKKVNESKCEQLTLISTNVNTNYIGLGGIDGFVKIVSFDASNKKKDTGEKNRPNLRYGQTLYAHKDEITIIAWNDNYNKLTTCDRTGQIVVWSCGKDGNWKEEMTNSRDESYVADIKWSKLGNFICFVYVDGYTIVGTVEGNRLWGNNIEKRIYLVEWSPDGSKILIATKNNNVIVLSCSGEQECEIEIEGTLQRVRIVSMVWWTNLFSQNRSITMQKHLLIAFENGTVCLYDNELDVEPLVIRTNLSFIIKAEWNLIGDVFAVCGEIRAENNRTGISFYTYDGELIRILKAPDPIVSFCWDSSGTKLALETKDSVYFALVKPKYKWCYFSDTLVYAYINEQEHYTLVYWDTKKNKARNKYVKNMLDITSSKDFCLVTAKMTDSSFLVILSNSAGSPVDNKLVNFDPILIGLNNTHAIVSNRHDVYIWQFRALQEETEEHDLAIQDQDITSSILKRSKMKEISFLIDDIPSMKQSYNHEVYKTVKKSKDAIVAVYLSENHLFLARSSGKVRKYALIDLSKFEEFNMKIRCIKIGASPNGQYFWAIDKINHLTIWNTEKIVKTNECEQLNFERKEVWSLLWSDESNLCFSFLEKNQLMVVNNLEIEDTLPCNGYLAEFTKVNITLAKLEDLMYKPWENAFVVHDIVIKLETKVLRQLKDLMKEKTPIDEVYNYVRRNSCPALWNALSIHSLNNLEFLIAEKGMIENKDLSGLQFIDKVKNIDDVNLQKAEVDKYNQNYENAEKIYNEKGRKDLSIEMRIKLGHWDKVVNMVEGCDVVNDENLILSYTNNADQLMEQKEYDKAEEYYKKAGNIEGLVNLWLTTDEFDKAARYIDKMPEHNDFLLFMGEKFETYGLCDEAVDCFIRYGDVKKAIDVCVNTNKWNLAIELAEKCNLFENESLVNQFGNILIEKNRKIDLVELYLKGHRHCDVAKVLNIIAEDMRGLNISPLIIKKIFVIAALEMESPKLRAMSSQIVEANKHDSSTKNIPDSNCLRTSDFNTLSDQTLNNIWKGAEAYHFYMLCQTQLHQNNIKEAFKTSVRLVLYEKELTTKEVYSLIALCAFMNQSYKECSKAISKLENLTNLSLAEKESYLELSDELFPQNLPENLNVKLSKCPTKSCDQQLNDL